MEKTALHVHIGIRISGTASDKRQMYTKPRKSNEIHSTHYSRDISSSSSSSSASISYYLSASPLFTPSLS